MGKERICGVAERCVCSNACGGDVCMIDTCAYIMGSTTAHTFSIAQSKKMGREKKDIGVRVRVCGVGRGGVDGVYIQSLF